MDAVDKLSGVKLWPPPPGPLIMGMVGAFVLARWGWKWWLAVVPVLIVVGLVLTEVIRDARR